MTFSTTIFLTSSDLYNFCLITRFLTAWTNSGWLSTYSLGRCNNDKSLGRIYGQFSKGVDNSKVCLVLYSLYLYHKLILWLSFSSCPERLSPHLHHLHRACSHTTRAFFTPPFPLLYARSHSYHSPCAGLNSARFGSVRGSSGLPINIICFPTLVLTSKNLPAPSFPFTHRYLCG